MQTDQEKPAAVKRHSAPKWVRSAIFRAIREGRVEMPEGRTTAALLQAVCDAADIDSTVLFDHWGRSGDQLLVTEPYGFVNDRKWHRLAGKFCDALGKHFAYEIQSTSSWNPPHTVRIEIYSIAELWEASS